MRYIAAWLLLVLGGNSSPSAADIRKVLGAVGIESDDSQLEKLISELDGKDIDQVPSGGGGGGAAPVAAAGGGGTAQQEEEKKEEEKEESDDDMGFGLFD